MGDPFEELGLPARFDLARAEIEGAYLRAVASCHPDLAGGEPGEGAEAARRSAALNRAKAALLDPESRARALLARVGGSTVADERELPDGFLAEILQTRMAVEEAAASGDAAEIARLRAWATRERGGYMERVGELFAKPEGPDARAIRRQLNAWRYIERMLEQVER